MGTAGFEPTTNKSGACRDTGLRHVPMALESSVIISL